MSNIRRFYLFEIPVFLTAVCHNRQKYLRQQKNKELLLSVMREVKAVKSFSMVAYAIMDNHFHCIIRPEDHNNFSKIMQSIKLRFTNRYKKNNGSESNSTLWQPRFWDHVIRDHNDMQRHIEYIHYNPVKHGYSPSPYEYQWSSFRIYVEREVYPKDWASLEEPKNLEDMNFE